MSNKKSRWVKRFYSLEDSIKSKLENSEKEVKKRIEDTSTAEEIVLKTWGWFWTLIIGSVILLSITLYGLLEPRFIITSILTLIAIPFWTFICLRNMIPEIKIFGFTIYSRDKLSIRQQLSVGGTIAKFFTKEFFRENPLAAWTIVGFIVLFFLSIILSI